MANEKILIVEDEMIVAKDIENILANRGFVVTAIANTGKKAIESIKKNKPDLILLDIVLKGKMDGIKTAEQIQKIFDIPIIFVTAFTNDTILQRAKKIEPYAYIVKPFEASELYTNIEMTLYKHKMKQALQESEERFKILFEYAPDAYYIHDLNGNLIDGNRAAEEITGYSIKELKGKNIFEINILPPEQIPRARELLSKGVKKIIRDSHEFTIIRKDGSRVYVEIRTFPVKIRGKTYMLGIAHDITHRKLFEETLKESEKNYRELVEKASVAILINDIDGNIKYFNSKFAEIFGYTYEEMKDKTFSALIHPDDVKKVLTFHKERINDKLAPKSYEFRGIKKDGSLIYVEVQTTTIKEKGKIVGTRSYLWDISARKNTEEELRILSLIDPLTGLYNRRGFLTLVRQQVDLANRSKKGFFLIFADIDRMKWINDNLGHHEGDRALKTIAAICKQSFRKSDIVGRLGGDEFAICAIEARKDSAQMLIKRLRKNLFNYNKNSQNKVKLSLSIGTTYYDPENPCPVEELLEYADKLMYEHKMQKHSPRLVLTKSESPHLAKKERTEFYLRSEVIKVLIIEDNPDDRDLFVKMLMQAKNNKFDVVHVKTLKNGLNYLAREPIDIVVLDLNLPDSMGFETLKKLHTKVPEIPIIVLTAMEVEDLAVKAIREGAQDCFAKGKFTADVLIRAIRYAIERKYAELELKNSFGKFLHVLEETINTLATVVEMRDPYTAGHQKRVSELAQAIAKEMKLKEEQIKGIKLAALIHDVGKTKVPEDILNKPEKLNANEMKVVKVHPIAGYDILKTIKFPWLIAQIVHQHHERLNGSGYPKGVKGKDILLEAKILAVADVVEAMSADRPYRSAPGLEEALKEIQKNSGKLYDKKVVETCLKLFKQGKFKFK
ncbi:MAG TPA: PAS domain S-box protein [candidate division WOR-3 bacterium]|uniref:PAS domain S-box protein n=1 Tax=candidate division WOR-3 bacterium TaxID=2052148 RepID=A0A9C9K0C5_UNCW3|nr:PAS domain S-box protein [candidate division WOR-3 bacterium]